MYHDVYAVGLLPDEQGELDGWTNLLQNLEEALHIQFGGSASRIDIEPDGDRVRVTMSSSDNARSLQAQLEDFDVVGEDETGTWEFSFDTVEVD